MNNKLFARIAAAAVGVSMLSTFVFADGTASLNADKSQLTLNTTAITSATGEDATQVTMMAYLVGADATIEKAYADETTTPMVALEQVAKGDVATKLATINVLASKFTDAFPQAIIKTGHNGTVSDTTGGVTWLIGTVSTPEGNKITIMNGATAIDIDVVNGVATLPTDTKFDKTSPAGYTFTLYSWVALDAAGNQKAEYVLSEGNTVKAADLEGVTLYAKFTTGIMRGAITKGKSVTALDYARLRAYVASGNKTNGTIVEPEIYEGGPKVGDLDGNGSITALDYARLRAYVASGNKTNKDMMESIITVVNK